MTLVYVSMEFGVKQLLKDVPAPTQAFGVVTRSRNIDECRPPLSLWNLYFTLLSTTL